MAMRELHVIVHEDAVRAYANAGSGVAKNVADEIERIKASQEHLEISSHCEPNRLHTSMPPPAEDLRVFVSGGYKATCCTLQLLKLREAGYKARFHPTANCHGQGVLPSMILQYIDERYPDFFDGLDG